MNTREERGLVIAAVFKITFEDGAYQVPAQSRPGKYTVTLGPFMHSCTCPDHESVGAKCKHMWAAEFFAKREAGVEIPVPPADEKPAYDRTTAPRKTYGQNWPAYNEAQTNEKRLFQELLRDLCACLDGERKPCRGRPRLLLSDAVFSATFKVYSTVSARRFSCDLEAAREKGYITAAPHFNSVLNCLENAAVTPVLSDMIVRSSLPLASVEENFAVDSTGFGASRFIRWFDKKYGKVQQEQAWVKCHVMCGVKTNIVTSVRVGNCYMHDAPMLPELVNETARNFQMREVSADKAYSSRRCLEAIAAHGAAPFVPFKSSAKPKGDDLFSKLYHYFNFNREDFMAHYHRRSNVESTMSMIKAKFRDHLRSKTDTAMYNEALAKVLCHNICCVIGAIYELGITPNFKTLAA